jgi:hypothetical protein
MMDLAELKSEIQIVLDKSDDTQLLEVVLALLHINTKPEIFDRSNEGSLGEQRKAVFEAGKPREQLANAIRKKILENLEK